jgi:hypothetical protein
MNAVVQTLSDLRNGGAIAPRAEHAPVRADFFDLQGFELLQRVAKAFASSSLVPAQYQGNLANCMIALNIARRLKADELMVMQNLYIVHGNPGWSAKFLIACVNTCGRFTALRYEWKGQPGADDFGCRAWAIERETNERLNGVWIDWKMVKAEGWNSKSGSKWKTMPDQMFVYRAAAFWQRAYAPEISMGLNTTEELADVVNVNADGTYTVTTESLRADMAHADVDMATGEISGGNVPPSDEAPAQEQAQPFDEAAFAKKLQACKDPEVLDLAADEIRDIADEAVRERLTEVYKARRKAIA